MADFSFFIPITKVSKQEDGSCLVSGYCSTPALDLDGEIVSLDAIKKAAPGYWEWRNVRRMHSNDAVGVGKELNIDGNGAFLTAKITDTNAVKGCVEGVYKGFSIGGRKLNKKGNTITEIDWVETSIVDRPANPECKFEVAKRAKDQGAAAGFLVKAAPSGAAQLTKALSKMATAAEILAKAPPAARDGFSLPAPVKCAAHGVLDCKKCAKAAKRAVKAAADVEKREFSSEQRQNAASSGAALPDGSFPIENGKDLENAIRAIGRAKDPAKARAHVKSRARALGMSDKIPEGWGKGAKVGAKRAAKLVKRAAAQKLATRIADGELDIGKSTIPADLVAAPSFLTLDVTKEESARALSGDEVEFGHGLDLVVRDSPRKDGLGESSFLRGRRPLKAAKSALFSKREKKLMKRMGVAGSLSYCFDSVREAQRALIWEAKREGGDMKDRDLALKLGSVAQLLAAVIGQKAEHEGQEALDFSDADDQGYDGTNHLLEVLEMSQGNDDLGRILAGALGKRAAAQPTRAQRMADAQKNMKKARGARKNCAAEITAAHKVLKAAYIAKCAALVKAGKKPDDDEESDTMEKALGHLQKAYGEISKVGTFSKAASEQLKKAARVGQKGQQPSDSEGDYYTPPPGVVRDLSQDDLATTGPGGGERGSMPHPHDLMNPYPDAGKGAKVRRSDPNWVSKAEADAAARVAALEAENALLKSMPAPSGKRPYMFDLTGGTGAGSSAATPSDPTMALLRDQEITKGVNLRDLASSEEGTHNRALGAVIGNMLIKGRGAKSVFDTTFHGTAGGTSSNS